MRHRSQRTITRLGWATLVALLTTGSPSVLAVVAGDTSPEATEPISLETPTSILLEVGDRGPAVIALQRLLNTVDTLEVTPDGIYGDQTAARLANLQRRQGTAPDGTQVTWQTWGTLWAHPWQTAELNLSSGGLLTAAEKTAQTVPDGRSPSPLWLILMPAIPLLGGVFTYWKRRLWGVRSVAADASDPVTAPTAQWQMVVINYFPLLGLTVVSATAFMVYIGVRAHLVGPVKLELEALATAQTEAVNTWFSQQRQGVLNAASAPEILPQVEQLVNQPNRPTPEAQAAYTAVATYLETLPEFGTAQPSVSLLSNGGIVVFSSEANREGQYQPLQNTTTYFTADQADQVPNLYVSPLTEALQITFATPVVNPEGGSRLGVIAIDLDLGNLQEQVVQVGREGTLPITDRASQHSYLVGRASRLKNQIISDDADLRAAYPEGVESRGIEEATQGNSATDLYLNYDKVPVIGVYRWLGRHNLALMVEVEQAEIFQPARRVAQQILIAGLALTALISVLLRRFVAPRGRANPTSLPSSLGDQQPGAPE